MFFSGGPALQAPLQHVTLGTWASKGHNWWSESEPRRTQWSLCKDAQCVDIPGLPVWEQHLILDFLTKPFECMN